MVSITAMGLSLQKEARGHRLKSFTIFNNEKCTSFLITSTGRLLERDLVG